MISNISMFDCVTLVVLFMTVLIPRCEPSSEEEPSVLVVTLDSMHRMRPPAPPSLTDRHVTLNYGRGYVKAMDFNYENKSFCYIHPKIPYRLSDFVCASVNNFTQSWELPKPALFPSQSAVTAMAYDWASGAWYFTDRLQRCLYMCDASLRHCRMLRRDVEDPRGLAVDPTPPRDESQTAGFVFWSQNNTRPSRLVRSDLAGGDVTSLLPKDCFGSCTPKALTLDVANKLIFWVDGEADTVEQSNYDGSARTSVYKIAEAYNKDIRVFSKFRSTLYLPGYRSVLTVPLNSTETTSTTVYGFPSVTAVYHGSRQPKVAHPCAEKNGGCEHICVTSYQGVTAVARCLCQHGFQLDETTHGVCTRVTLDSLMLVSRGTPPVVEVRAPLSHPLVAAPAASHQPTVADIDLQTEYIYFVDSYLNQIFRQKLDGTGREEFIKDGINECHGLAVDWMGGNLYWTDDPQGKVFVARLSAPAQRRELIQQGFYHPRSIVLDPQRGVMYWSVWARASNPYGSIETANMDGSARRTLVSDGLEWPNGLVVDTDKQVLYWCDTKLDKIESLQLASNKRTTILAAPRDAIKEPYGLALLDGEVVWSEKSGRLQRVGANARVSLLDTVAPPLFDIRLVSKSARNGSNACSENNGGCAELCLARAGGRTCACAAGRAPLATDPTRCVQAN